ncbi:hypothetical protein [Salipiger mangrovisoli]|uniref:UrcA family protein n=1 Tax=Salipiger mangrovisoli TaxID=2865933 RepID=A0ABR9X5C1_9RHOB|nr:hypothetical protein [Salipiger mangrovisoli]MBE9638799.1 hypothetical protein [Salipiger mangrovisoli]
MAKIGAVASLVLVCAIADGTPPAAAQSGEDAVLIFVQAHDRDKDRDRDRDESGDQDRDQDRDQHQLRDRDWTTADKDLLREKLRDGSCQEVMDEVEEIMEAMRPCLGDDRLNERSCAERLQLGDMAFRRMREVCREP